MAFITIKPNDALFFRAGKPFVGGIDSWTDSSFLPNPSVIWGALFSVLYAEKKIKIKNGKVEKSEREKLKIENIYLYNEKTQTVLLPAPLDIFVDDENKIISPEYKDVDFVSNYPLEVINIVENKNVKTIENSFIEINSIYQHYTKKYFNNLIIYKFEDIFVSDYKIGIKIDRRTRASEDKHLYRIDLTQFKEEWSFLIEYDLKDVDFPQKGILKLGGEGKTATYRKIEKPASLYSAESLKEKVPKEIKNINFIKVLFKTPAYFKNGWQPDIKTLVCANVGKPIFIGGFDMEKQEPKPMKKYIPAGSVYVFCDANDFNKTNLDVDDESYKGFGKYELLTV